MKTSDLTDHRASVPSGKGVKVEKTITINVPPQEIYTFWRRLENLPRFMKHIESIVERDNRRSHWVVKSPTGNLRWDAEIIEDRPNQMISWHTLPDADVDNAGSVWFKPTPDARGTEVKVSLKYLPPAGKAGAMLAKIFHLDADSEIEDDLRRLKQMLESKSIPRM